MAAKQIVPGLYTLPLGGVNTFLLDGGDGLTLIDTGTPDSVAKILEAVRSLGKQPGDIRYILVTHCHFDHTGGLAELKEGGPANITVLELLKEEVPFVDFFGQTMKGKERLVCRWLINKGKVLKERPLL